MREDGRCSAAAWRWDVSRRVQSSAKGMGVRRRASIPSVWSRSGASMGAAWACPIRAYGMRRRRFCGGRSTGLRFSLWTRPIARAAGPHGDRRWAGRSIFMREEAIATGPRGVSRWTLRTWIVFFPCGTGWRRGDPPLDKLHSNGASAILRVAAQGAVQTANHPCQEVWRAADPQPQSSQRALSARSARLG